MPRIHWVTSFLLSYILRYVSFGEVGRICRAVLWEPMHLCTCVSEEGGDGEAACSETPSLLSYILRYVSFGEVGRICRTVLWEPMNLCTCVSEKGGDGEASSSETRGRQNLPDCVVRTDAPVYMREGEGGRRGSCVFRNTIVAVIHT
jgi:hypothetical protein